MKRVLGAAAAIATLLLTSVGLASTATAASEATAKDIVITGGPTSATNPKAIDIDARIYLPATTPAPAVVLAHGFGGSKASVEEQALGLRDEGFVVLAYSARGFGKTVASISMNSPQFEVADAQKLIDYLANRTEVLQDTANDPRVGFAGGSYGGAISLLVAGYDARVDAVSSDITWNNMQSALFAQNIAGSKDFGVFKQMWASYFFSVGMATPPKLANPCGRFSPEWCAAYTEGITTGRLSPASVALMQASSPSSVAARITAPTMLMAGQADSLFPLTEATKTFEQIRAANPLTPLKLVWHGAGHDGGVNETDRLRALTLTWFQKHLEQKNVETGPLFEATLASGSIVSNNNRNQVKFFTSNVFDSVNGFANKRIALAGDAQNIVAPAGGQPALMTVLPGLGGSVASLLGRSFPNQSAYFESKPFEQTTPLIGASRVTLRVTPTQNSAEMVLFTSLRIINGEQSQRFPNGLVAPLRLTDLVAGTPVEVEVHLPAIVAEISAGEKLQLVVSTTDAAYRLPTPPSVYTIDVVDNEVVLPVMDVMKVSTDSSPLTAIYTAVAVMIAVVIILWLRRPQRKAAVYRADLAEVPLQVENLVKEFKGGQRAVNDISWSVPSGVVLGLLGPNGAGKTTTMRMAMGLISPTSGAVYVYGHQVQPGSPALSRIGALVEGAGFLPHLTGRENLELFWKASGRTTEDPKLDAVLAIADLGTAVDRKVRTYSQGMRQRLGIAQAMLGMPDLLMLDEPTNGLDPPQIRAMRAMVQEYAATGRTVIVSSHLLSEVEQTCSHVIVMHRGQLVTSGRVDELLAGRSNVRLEDFFLEVVGDDLTIGRS